MIDWLNNMKLMLPTALRQGRRLRCLMQALTHRPTADATAAEAWKEELKDEMRYVGQAAPLEELLNAKHGPGIEIGGYAESDAVYFSAVPGAAEAADGRYPSPNTSTANSPNRVYMMPTELVDLGHDFSVVVPEGTDVAAVADTVRRYTFMGVGFVVIIDN